MSGHEACARGALPDREYDIHCPMMGGAEYKLNYLRISCQVRIANRSCKVKDCVQRGGTVTKAATEHRVDGRQKMDVKRTYAKHGECACGCGRVGKIAARGLSQACYSRWHNLKKKDREDEFGPVPLRTLKKQQKVECACGCGKVGKAEAFGLIKNCYSRLQRMRAAGREDEFWQVAGGSKRGVRHGECACGCGRVGLLKAKGMLSACYQRELKARKRSDSPKHLERAQAQQKPIEKLPAASRNSVTIFFPEVDEYILEEMRKQSQRAGTDLAEDIKSVLHMFVCGDLVIKEG